MPKEPCSDATRDSALSNSGPQGRQEPAPGEPPPLTDNEQADLIRLWDWFKRDYGDISKLGHLSYKHALYQSHQIAVLKAAARQGDPRPSLPPASVFPQHVEEIHTKLHSVLGKRCTVGGGWCKWRDAAYEIDALCQTT